MPAPSSFRLICVSLVFGLLTAGCRSASAPIDWEREKARRRAEHAGASADGGDRASLGGEDYADGRRTEGPGWEGWIASQSRPDGPIVLERGDLVLSAAIARAQHGRSDGTRLTHLRMTAAARELIAGDETERALDLLERAIAIDGREGFAYLYLGYVYARRGEVERARGFLDQAARLLPRDPKLQREVADIRRAAGPVGARRGGALSGGDYNA